MYARIHRYTCASSVAYLADDMLPKAHAEGRANEEEPCAWGCVPIQKREAVLNAWGVGDNDEELVADEEQQRQVARQHPQGLRGHEG